ncbi:hypothetical protein CC80DRAFT_42513 [Byssothecium circinans]|uniref:F-box domain-containing protein n=1 Tax=Byssothecium circinans TaxID=147558 RepID=A0A6A5TXF4_9PLEO|nr:hypothetical protein CC80DRAFT_42513 [Byssothecium circinans]
MIKPYCVRQSHRRFLHSQCKAVSAEHRKIKPIPRIGRPPAVARMPTGITDLPNEIDNQIASVLDTASLVALCQVSRHWLKVARPFLYVNVKFTTRSGLEVKQLLFQFLKYPDLGVWGDDDVREAEEVRSEEEE